MESEGKHFPKQTSGTILFNDELSKPKTLVSENRQHLLFKNITVLIQIFPVILQMQSERSEELDEGRLTRLLAKSHCF